MYKWRKWPIQTIGQDKFPSQLKKIRNCPKKLYYRGKWKDELFIKTLSVVGSRNMTRYGKDIIEKFIPELVLNKVNIISGFMYGIDSEAHKSCIEAGGITIAVLGGGLDILMPNENDKLYTDILETGGLVISEYEADFKPTLWSFPQRNRIVSGLSDIGVLIIEAGLKSGSLVTAKIAHEQKKKIFAIPGPINSKMSAGTNYLIKNRLAKLTESVEDIVGNPINLSCSQENIFRSNLSNMESDILKIIHFEPLSIDDISRCLNTPISDLSATISMMILKNLIIEIDNKFKDRESNQQ